MKKIRHFLCGFCARRYEKLVEDGVNEVDCECGAKAAKQLSAPKCFQNTVGKSPSVK